MRWSELRATRVFQRRRPAYSADLAIFERSSFRSGVDNWSWSAIRARFLARSARPVMELTPVAITCAPVSTQVVRGTH
jgi:hypothetical protein